MILILLGGGTTFRFALETLRNGYTQQHIGFPVRTPDDESHLPPTSKLK
jgi:hypothetical protein